MWAWLRGQTQPPPRAYGPAFDAVVDVAPDIQAGLSDAEAMAHVTAAVRSLPGAARVRVRVGALATAARVFPAGTGRELTDEAWSALRARVEGAVRAALNAPEPRRHGFAEASGALDALAELAALAQSVREPPAPRAAVARDRDVAALARLLGFVLPVEDRVAASAAIRRFGSFAAVLAAPETELRGVPGLGTHSVAAIKLVHEAAVRLARAGLTGQPVLDDPARLQAYLATAIGRERVEQFRILFLDERGMLKADEVQATGTVNHTPVYPREVLRRALELNAAALVLVHNHPSGDPTPSGEDLAMTAEIRRAAEALGVALRDHVIVGNGRVMSFREAGLL
jgi:DNA repair protein RadC